MYTKNKLDDPVKKVVSFSVVKKNHEIFKRIIKLYGLKQSTFIDHIIAEYISNFREDYLELEKDIKSGEINNPNIVKIFNEIKELNAY